MNIITYIFISFLVIIIIVLFGFLICSFTKRTSPKGKTALEGELEFFKILKIKFKAEHDNNKK